MQPVGSGALCERGNPAMAAAGMGDVLTGAIAGILAPMPRSVARRARRRAWRMRWRAMIWHASAGERGMFWRWNWRAA